VEVVTDGLPFSRLHIPPPFVSAVLLMKVQLVTAAAPTVQRVIVRGGYKSLVVVDPHRPF
jgi:hypothetical protein